MRAESELSDATKQRLIEFAGAASAQPAMVAKAVLGYVNDSIYRWLRGDCQLRAHTLATLNEWMDENTDWRPARRGRRKGN